MTGNTLEDFEVGDKVVFPVSWKSARGVWTVQKKLRVNMDIEQNGHIWRARPGWLEKIDDPSTVTESLPPCLQSGSVVTVDGKTGYFVVLSAGDKSARVAGFGGSLKTTRVKRDLVKKVKGVFVEGGAAEAVKQVSDELSKDLFSIREGLK